MALNGESIPFRKTTEQNLRNLYCGTTILVSQSYKYKYALAEVTHIGFNSEQG